MSKLDASLVAKLNELKADYLNKSLEVFVKRLLTIKADYKQVRVSYKCEASMAFPSREIRSIEWQEVGETISVVVSINFFGLQSVNSPLPLNLHEQLVHDINSDNYELDDFYNFFNNRLIELLVESFYKKDVLAKDSALKDIWANIVGIALQLYADDKEVFYRLMNRADLLFSNKLSSNNIAKLVEVFFDFDMVKIENFVPRTVRLEDKNLTKLSEANSSIDGGFVLGNQIVDIQNNCRFDIYLTKPAEYLPNGSKNELLRKLISYLMPNHLLYTISLHLPENIPMVLSDESVYLGWTTMVTYESQPQTIYLEGN